MTKTHKTHKMFNGILGLFLAVLLLTACGKKGQDEFEKGKALYTAQDYKTAVTQFALAADKGHAEAQYIIGRCYAEGKGVEQDMSEAVKWYRKAADNGNEDAKRNLGKLTKDQK